MSATPAREACRCVSNQLTELMSVQCRSGTPLRLCDVFARRDRLHITVRAAHSKLVDVKRKPTGRYFREDKHAMVGGGTNEIQRSIIAKEMGL